MFLKRLKLGLVLFLLLTVGIFAFLKIPPALADPGNIDSIYKWSWGENIGWQNWESIHSGVTVFDDRLEGYIWAENIGWINLSCRNNLSCATVDFEVINDGAGNLSGYAWGENVGWINFNPTHSQVTIDGAGNFSGYAWGENVGWINMSCVNSDSCMATDFKVKTSWVPSGVSPPTVSTLSATNIQSDQAQLNGDLIDMGGDSSCDVWFEWGLTDSYGNETTQQSQSSAGVFNATIADLSPGTTYHFRAVASNSAGTNYGTDESFSTSSIAPISLSGWVWAANIGWVSFSCDNTELPEPRCSIDYRVKIDPATGNLYGYAWSRGTDEDIGGIGWIDFDPPGSYPNCPPATCPDGSPDHSAQVVNPGQLGIGDVKVEGWVRALSYGGGWDGWILFGPIVTGGTDYGFSLDENLEFKSDSWAWGSDIIGWMKFSPEIIPNQSPSATPLPVSVGDYCTTPVPIYLSWDYSDPDNVPPGTDPQSAYHIQIDNDFDFSSPEENTAATSSSYQYAPTNLSYGGIPYYWRVKVWDSHTPNPGESVWANGPSFTTAHNPYPSPDFEWSPSKPTLEEAVVFTDLSSGGAPITSREWTFENGDPPNSIDNETNPEVTFLDRGAGNQNQVTLKVTDSSGYECTEFKFVPLGLPLPWWQEIVPF